MCFAELWQHTQALYAEMQCMSYQHVVAIAYYGLLLSDTGTMFVIFRVLVRIIEESNTENGNNHENGQIGNA